MKAPWIKFVSLLFLVKPSIGVQPLKAMEQLLHQLMVGPLRGLTVFIVDDLSVNGTKKSVDWSGILSSDTKVMFTSTTSFKVQDYPAFSLSESIIVVIWLINQNYKLMDGIIGKTMNWCPPKLIIICNYGEFSKIDILNQRIAKNTQYVTLMEIKNNDISKVELFTNFPMTNNYIAALGYWKANEDYTRRSLFRERFEHFGGTVLKVATFCDDFPFLYPSGAVCIGASFDLLTIVGEALNFSYVYQNITADQEWGAFVNGSWTGMLADLAYHEQNIIINYFLVNLERWTSFDSTYPYHNEGFGFLAHLPKPLPKWKSLLLPFSGKLWAATIVCTMFVAVTFAFLLAVISEDPKNKDYVSNILAVSKYFQIMNLI